MVIFTVSHLFLNRINMLFRIVFSLEKQIDFQGLLRQSMLLAAGLNPLRSVQHWTHWDVHAFPKTSSSPGAYTGASETQNYTPPKPRVWGVLDSSAGSQQGWGSMLSSHACFTKPSLRSQNQSTVILWQLCQRKKWHIHLQSQEIKNHPSGGLSE